jgi:ElaB/YqjD/DUF883 family membrane-anchored ribosome-binding protein
MSYREVAVVTDAIASRELKSLQEEMLAALRERTAAPAAPAAMAAGPAEPAEGSSGERELREQLRELLSEATTFFEEAEQSISAHPTQSVVGALLVGILIGRLLGRR